MAAIPVTNVTDSSTIPVTSAYYLGSSDNPGSILVSNVFNGVGFTAWKRSMMIALSAKNKLGFVDGSITQPAIDSSDYSQWNRVNFMVISWLLNSLHKNIADSVLFLQTASAIWTELNQRYEQTSGALIYQIQQNLYSVSQGSDDFRTYYTKLMRIWDELHVIQDFPECSCGTATKIHKFLEDQRLIQLLMGLNDSYKIVRGQILMMKPLPSLSTAYALITQEEHQREINVSSVINHDAIAMNATADQYNKFSKTCSHCKKTGHTKAQCYRLVGFPANFKFTKGKKTDHQSTVQNVTVTPDTSSPNITTEQYQQLFQMLNNHQLNSSSLSSHVNASVHNGAMNPEGLERLPFKNDGYKFWTWRGHKIHYVEEGEGFPIVLIHGFGASAFHWRYNIPELAKKYKVYAVDLLGFGWSEKALVDYDALVWRDQVADFLKEIVKGPTILVGNSLGGFTALVAAEAMPQQVVGIALLNSAGQFGSPDAATIETEEESPLQKFLLKPLKEIFQRVVLGFLFWQAKQPARVESVLKSVYKNTSNVDDYLIESITKPADDPNAGEVYYRLMTRFMSNQRKYTLDSVLSKLSCPLLLVWGDLDPWVGPAKAIRIKEFYPNTSIVNLQAGHCPHDEVPELVNKALVDWLATLPSTSTAPQSV